MPKASAPVGAGWPPSNRPVPPYPRRPRKGESDGRPQDQDEEQKKGHGRPLAVFLAHHGQHRLLGLLGFLGNVGSFGPDVEAAAVEVEAAELFDFPNPPDAVAVVVAPVGDRVFAEIALDPLARAGVEVVAALDGVRPDKVPARAREVPVAAGQTEVRLMPSRQPELQEETGPGTAGETGISFQIHLFMLPHQNTSFGWHSPPNSSSGSEAPPARALAWLGPPRPKLPPPQVVPRPLHLMLGQGNVRHHETALATGGHTRLFVSLARQGALPAAGFDIRE